MRTDDLGPVAELTAAAFSRELDDEIAERRWRERIAHPLSTDPDGAFVAELSGRVIGVAQAIVRERLWILSMFAVQPATQSGGAGRALLEHAVGHGRETEAGLIVSSNDPRALRLYARAVCTGDTRDAAPVCAERPVRVGTERSARCGDQYSSWRLIHNGSDGASSRPFGVRSSSL
jgi:ribosomal protein S18 acetylase RimI-like enzyme